MTRRTFLGCNRYIGDNEEEKTSGFYGYANFCTQLYKHMVPVWLSLSWIFKGKPEHLSHNTAFSHSSLGQTLSQSTLDQNKMHQWSNWHNEDILTSIWFRCQYSVTTSFFPTAHCTYSSTIWHIYFVQIFSTGHSLKIFPFLTQKRKFSRHHSPVATCRPCLPAIMALPHLPNTTRLHKKLSRCQWRLSHQLWQVPHGYVSLPEVSRETSGLVHKSTGFLPKLLAKGQQRTEWDRVRESVSTHHTEAPY